MERRFQYESVRYLEGGWEIKSNNEVIIIIVISYLQFNDRLPMHLLRRGVEELYTFLGIYNLVS